MTEGIVLVGVGGQGILLTAKIVAEAAMHAGYDVKLNEIHGMAQRGGSVVAQIRFGKDVCSPLVPAGGASVLVGLEKVEALRQADYLAPDGLAVVADVQLVPTTVTSGAAVYPDDIDDRLAQRFGRLVMVDCVKLAKEAGNVRTANVALVGTLSKHMRFDESVWLEAIRRSVPRALDVNLKAFELGRNVS